MHKKNTKSRAKAWLLLVGVSIAVGIGCLFWINQTYIFNDNNNENILYNHLIGFAPSADYSDAVGKNSLVYIDILWSEIEAEEGKYDFRSVYEKNHIEKWKKNRKKAVFRFVCDKPGSEEHMDIPQWLYEKTGGDGDFYDMDYGKGYAPDYSNEIFIEAHKKVVFALAQEFGKDNFFAYIELGSIGHWGEWHVKYDAGIKRLPSEEICALYVEHYREAFPDTRLLMRRPFYEVKKYGLGVFNDMTGEAESTHTWLEWIREGGNYDEPVKPHRIVAADEVWNYGTIGGEFTSRYSWEEMLSENWEETKQLILDSHMSFIGPKCPHEKSEGFQREQSERVLPLLGYKIGIGEGKLNYNKLTKNWKVSLVWNNKGVAPMYYNWPVYLYLLSDNGDIQAKIPIEIELTKLKGGSEIQTNTKFLLEKYDLEKEDIAAIGVGIEDPMFEQPAIHLNNKNAKMNTIYKLWDLKNNA